MALVETDVAVDFLSLGTLSATDEASLTALIERISDAIERDLGWYFGPSRAKEEILDGTGTSKLFVRQPPLDEDAVVVRNRSGVGGDWEVVDPDLYEVEGRGIYADGRWVRGKRNFRVDYDEGFAEAPGEIQQLVLEVVSNAWRNRDTDPVGIVAESIGDYSYSKGVLQLQNADSYADVRSSWRRLRV